MVSWSQTDDLISTPIHLFFIPYLPMYTSGCSANVLNRHSVIIILLFSLICGSIT